MSRRRRRYTSQPRILGMHRQPMATAVEHQIEEWIRAQQREFGVSRSFVIAVACADAAGIKLGDKADYRS